MGPRKLEILGNFDLLDPLQNFYELIGHAVVLGECLLHLVRVADAQHDRGLDHRQRLFRRRQRLDELAAGELGVDDQGALAVGKGGNEQFPRGLVEPAHRRLHLGQYLVELGAILCIHLRYGILLEVAIADADPLHQQVVVFRRVLAPADDHRDRVAAHVLEQVQRLGGVQIRVLAPIVVIALVTAVRQETDRRGGAHLGHRTS